MDDYFDFSSGGGFDSFFPDFASPLSVSPEGFDAFDLSLPAQFEGAAAAPLDSEPWWVQSTTALAPSEFPTPETPTQEIAPPATLSTEPDLSATQETASVGTAGISETKIEGERLTEDVPLPPVRPVAPIVSTPSYKVPADIRSYIADAAQRSGVPEHVLLAIAKQESSFNPNARASTSSAKGLYQFLDGTWSSVVSKAGALYGIAANASPLDPKASAYMGAEFARQNAKYLEGTLGRPVKDGEYYVAHFMGAGGAVSLIRKAEQNPNGIAALSFPKAAAANHAIYYNKDGTPRTHEQVYHKLLAYVDNNKNWQTAPQTQTASATPTTPLPQARPEGLGQEPTRVAEAPIPASAVMADAKAQAQAPQAQAPVNFGQRLTFNDFTPPPSAMAPQGQVMAANEKAADREAESSWYSNIGNAFSQNNLTSRIYQAAVAPRFEADTSFVMSQNVQTDLMTKYSLRPEYQERLGDAVSMQHAEYIAKTAQSDQAREDALDRSGWGTALRLGAAILDPVAIGVGVATGGLGDAAVVAAGGGRALRIGAQAVAGSASNVAVDLALSNLGDPNAGRHLMMSAAVGAMFGAGYGLLSRNPAVMEEAAQIQAAASTLRRSLQDAPSETFMGRSVGAAENPHVNEPALNDPAFKAVGQEDAPYTAFHKKLFGGIPLRFDVVGQLKSSKNPLSRLYGSLGEDAVGNADHSVNAHAVSEEMDRFHRDWSTDLNQTWVPAVRQWFADNKVPFAQRWSKAAEFNNLVYQYVVNRNPTIQFDASVARVGDKIRKLNSDILNLAKNPFEREQMIGRSVRGFEDVPENQFYMMRAYDQEKVNAARVRFTDKGITEWYRRAIRSAQPNIEDDILDALSSGMTKRITDRANGIDDRLNMMMSGFDREQLRDVLREAGIPETKITSYISSIKENKKTGADPRAKHRVILDENFVLREYPTTDGGTADLSLNDLVVNDAAILSDLYFRRMAGRVALARWRLKNPKSDELLVNGVSSDNEFEALINRMKERAKDDGIDPRQTAKDEANMRFLYERILGRTDPDQLGEPAKWLRRARQFNYMRLGGSFGWAQLPETMAPIAQLGVKAALSHMPAFRRIISSDGETILRDGLAREIEAMWGLGTDRLRGKQFFRYDDFGHSDVGVGATLDNALSYGQRFVSDASGLNFVNAALQRWTGKAIAQKFADMAIKGGKANAHRMRALGLSDEMLERVLREVKGNFTTEDGLLFKHKVTRMNLDKWTDKEARAAFERAVFRWARRIIQENDIGNAHRWMSKPIWQMLFQFRAFTLNAWAKQFLHNLHMRDAQSFNLAWMTMVAGSLIYSMQTQVTSIGRSDRADYLRKRMNVKNIALGGIQRAGWTSILPMMADTTMYLSGQHPIFDFRTSGQASDLIWGNPTMSFLDDIAKASRGAISPIKEHRARSQQEYRNILRVFPLANLMPVGTLLSTMVQNKPAYPPRGTQHK